MANSDYDKEKATTTTTTIKGDVNSGVQIYTKKDVAIDSGPL